MSRFPSFPKPSRDRAADFSARNPFRLPDPSRPLPVWTVLGLAALWVVVPVVGGIAIWSAWVR